MHSHPINPCVLVVLKFNKIPSHYGRKRLGTTARPVPLHSAALNSCTRDLTNYRKGICPIVPLWVCDTAIRVYFFHNWSYYFSQETCRSSRNLGPVWHGSWEGFTSGFTWSPPKRLFQDRLHVWSRFWSRRRLTQARWSHEIVASRGLHINLTSEAVLPNIF